MPFNVEMCIVALPNHWISNWMHLCFEFKQVALNSWHKIYLHSIFFFSSIKIKILTLGEKKKSLIVEICGDTVIISTTADSNCKCRSSCQISVVNFMFQSKRREKISTLSCKLMFEVWHHHLTSYCFKNPITWDLNWKIYLKIVEWFGLPGTLIRIICFDLCCHGLGHLSLD